ncbi:MAG: T9SS type A sorting domain-containing protein [Candidatus Zixiibacteriota bacterium]
MMRLGKCLAIGLVVLLPAMAMAAVGPASKDALDFGRPSLAAAAGNGAGRLITVPVTMENIRQLAAVDMPLQFGQPGDGIELREVQWDPRIDYFDVKVANIDNQNKRVLIGLVPLAFDPNKARMEAGTGKIADLVFEITNPATEEFTISTYTTERPHHKLMYVASEVDAAGKRTVTSTEPAFQPFTVRVDAASANPLPTQYSLLQNYPNPFNAGTAIRFDMPSAGNANLSIYNVLGQTVRTFSMRDIEAGSHTIEWDGRNEQRETVASGIYFYRLQANEFVATKKMTLLK